MVFPNAANRFCVRHLTQNMKSHGYRGQHHSNLLWDAANSTTIPQFDECMNKIADFDIKQWEWLQDKHPSEWSKSHFTTYSKCEMLLNNVCESFNAIILEARTKAILTMLEWIRIYIMGRIQRLFSHAEKRWEGRMLCPKIRKLLEKTIKRVGKCIPKKSDDWHYEVTDGKGDRFTVDLLNHSCACRVWDLCGIPCIHGISAISAQKWNPENFVHKCYHVETFTAVYSHPLPPMDGPQLWEKTGYIPPMPPNFGKKKRGRPHKMKRRLEEGESSKKKKKPSKKKGDSISIPKQKHSVICTFCGGPNHNKRSCQWKKFAEEIPTDEGVSVNPSQNPNQTTEANENLTQELLVSQLTQENAEPVPQMAPQAAPQSSRSNNISKLTAKKQTMQKKGGNRDSSQAPRQTRSQATHTVLQFVSNPNQQFEVSNSSGIVQKGGKKFVMPGQMKKVITRSKKPKE